MGLNLVIIAAYVGNFLWRRGELGAGVALGPLILSAVSLGALGFSGYLGGKLAFRYGVRVVEESTQAEGFQE